jgi:glucoamylase
MDSYDGVSTSIANPWYLCTMAHAEFLYRLSAFSSQSLFRRLLYTTSRLHRAFASDDDFKAQGDEFVGVVRDFARSNGSMNEQFSRSVIPPPPLSLAKADQMSDTGTTVRPRALGI